MGSFDLISAALSNAVVATILALCIYPLCRWANCPRCGHFLWVLVLVKLVTPPILDIPIPLLPSSWNHFAVSQVEGSQTAAAKFNDGISNSANRHHDRLGRSLSNDTAQRSDEKFTVTSDVPAGTGVFPSILARFSPTFCLLLLWIAGAILYGGYQIYVTWQMCVLMRLATPDPRIDRAMNRIAREARISNYPTARVVPWVGSPMLWGLRGTSVIVLPRGLFASIDDDAACTLMQHELAHFQRGDQWIRILEVITSSLYWWHPVVWVAKHEIEVYEEQCCDAWVVQHNHSNRRRYAEALLDTVDYISEAPETAMPLAASGLGRVPLLKQRLKTIMRGSVPTVGPGKRMLLGAFLVALPLQLSLTSVAAKVTPVGSQDTILPAEVSNENSATSDRQASNLSGVEYARATSVYGRWELIATSGFHVVLREVVSGKPHDLAQHKISCAAFVPPKADGPDKPKFVAGSNDGRALLFDCESGEVERVLAEFGKPIRSVCFSPIGKQLAIAGDDGLLAILDVDSGAIVRLNVGVSRISSVRFSSDGRQVVIAKDTSLQLDKSGAVEVWDVKAQTRTNLLACPVPVGVAEFSAERAGGIVTAEWDGTVRVWKDGVQVLGQNFPKDVVSAAAFSTNAISLSELILTEDHLSNTKQPSI